MGGAFAGTFDECEALLQADLESRDAYRCFYRTSRRTGAYDEALDRLVPIVEANPDNPWAQMTTANLMSDQGIEGAEARYRIAIEKFEAIEEVQGHVFARLNLGQMLSNRGRPEEASLVFAEAAEAALQAERQDLWSISQIERARLMWRRQHRLGQAYTIAREVEKEVFPDGNYQGRIVTLHTLAQISEQVGRYEEAAGYQRRLVDMAREEGDRYAEANSLQNLAFWTMSHPYLAELHELGDAESLISQAIEAGEAGGNPYVVASMQCTLALFAEGAEAAAMAQQCVDAPLVREEPDILIDGLMVQSWVLKEQDPAGALAAIEEARKVAEDLAWDGWLASVAWRYFEHLEREGKNDAALQEAYRALEYVEASRAAQEEQEAGAGQATHGAGMYYGLASRLAGLTPWSKPDPDAALAVMSRYRAWRAYGQRQLTESEFRQIDALSKLKDQLWEPQESDEARKELLARIADAQQQVVQRAGVVETAPTVKALQASLAPGEALVQYNYPERAEYDEEAVAPWAAVISREGVRFVPLTRPTDLSERVEALVVALQGRDLPTDAAVAGIAAEVWAEVAAALPPRTHTVRIVTDGPLHRVPFALFAPELQFSRIASLGHWLSAKRAEPIGLNAPVLVLGDPKHGPDLPPLPAARDEAAAVAQALSGEARFGAMATESAVSGLQDLGLVHFAAHAVVDSAFPELSAIRLSEDSSADGRLTVGEIRQLRLDGTVVVLSACQSAGGRAVGADGPVSLSQAFQHAGAGVVLGSLWPLQDKEAATFSTAFYGQLAHGVPVGRAAVVAREALRASGAPPAAWAAMVVLGDDRVQLEPRKQPSRLPALLAGLAAIGVVVFVGMSAYRRRGDELD